ncbi:MAG TPA: O-antigen ligase family protein [Fimbriimonas sp.]|nr:O-antigen ligase family protein [Fimbriimonas sp.]
MNVQEARKPQIGLPLGLVLVSAFFTPILGGYIQQDQTKLAPGLGSALSAAFFGSDAPVLAHALLALPLLAAAVAVLLTRRVQQVPKQHFSLVWLLFFVAFGGSIFFSSFKFQSLGVWIEWAIYGCALFTVSASSGRRTGPLAVVMAVGAGGFIVALRSIYEYGENRATNPTWRVYGGWMNPNATAAIMLIALFVLLGVCLSRNRVEALLTGLAALLIAFALPLTGSKGAVSFGLPLGLLAMAPCLCRIGGVKLVGSWVVCGIAALAVAGLFVKNVGWLGIGLALLVFCFVVGAFGSTEKKIQIGRLIAVFAGSALLSALLLVTTPSTGPKAGPGAAPQAVASTPIARVGSGSDTQEQSSEFRLNLWKSSLQLVKDSPITGWGPGCYRFESGRPGLTTETVFAHSVYLQLWAEGGSVTLLLFLGGVACWFWLVLRNASSLPVPQQALLAGVVASLIALLAHALVDSDLYYFGIGLSVFMLFGVGLSISTDSVAPELIPKQVRVVAAAASVGLGVLLFFFAADDVAKSTFRQTNDGQSAGLDSFAPFDGEARYLTAWTQTGEQQLKTLKSAYQDFPAERVARTMATLDLNNHDPAAAITILKDALKRDPNNFNTLNALIRAQIAADQKDQAVETAKRLVDTEETPYFKVRSIPESVPTDTYMVRFLVLAPNETDPKKRADILAAGVRGMVEYTTKTVGTIAAMWNQNNHDDTFKAPGYDSYQEAAGKLSVAADGARQASALYQGLGDRKDAAEMEADGRLLAGALGGNK